MSRLATRTAAWLHAAKIKPMLGKTVRRDAHAVGSGVYRAMEPAMYYGPQVRVMKALQVITWGWVFYNFWYDPEMALGHPGFELPEPELWTDEELGIPPDDYNEVV